eukprot:COSAG05_NODE_4156_length_1650_cov_1.038040_2_plen_157_part_00
MDPAAQGSCRAALQHLASPQLTRSISQVCLQTRTACAQMRVGAAGAAMAPGAGGDGDGGGGGAEGEGEWRPWLQGGVILFDDRYVYLSIYLLTCALEAPWTRGRREAVNEGEGERKLWARLKIISNLKTMHESYLPTFLMRALRIIFKRTRMSENS